MSPVQKWILAARPKTLWASVAPVTVGTAMAFEAGRHHWPSAFMALICGLLIQIGTNLANDYFDHQQGADTAERQGPMRLTQSGLVTPQTMKRATALVFLLACVAGLYLVIRGGLPVFLVGIFCILAGVLYTGGPFPYGYHGLGDVICLVFFGPVAVGGTYYVQALEINSLVVIAGLGPGLLTTAILTVNNLRDMEEDRQTGKRTLAVCMGKPFTRWEYAVLIVSGASIPLFLYFRTGQHPGSLISLAVIAIAWPAFRTLATQSDGPSLNPILAATARLLLIYSVLFSVGWIL